MNFLEKVQSQYAQADSESPPLTKQEREIKKFSADHNRFRHFKMSDLKPYPTIKAYYEGILKRLAASKISFDEAAQHFECTNEEVLETVFGKGWWSQD